MGSVEPAPPRHLLNDDGSCFADLQAVAAALESLATPERESYRNGNARAIARVDSARLLVVAGPGAGKSHLFLSRIEYWLPSGADRTIYVSTFVRKLVNDLRSELQAKLSEDDQKRVQVSTLHTLARSLLERSGGTAAHPMRSYVRIVDAFWANVVWDDVLQFHQDLSTGAYTLEDLEAQFNTGESKDSVEWIGLHDRYRALSRFYNAVGFAYLIAFACEAVEEMSELNEHELWIIDEYQDFNPAEDKLIRTLVQDADGVLLAGDDEQALYQTLKASSPDIIIGHYNDVSFAKAMLPFCSRCSFYICRAASAFMSRHRTAEAIDKIYLPLKVELDVPKVQIVATAAASGAVDFVRLFLEEHDDEYTRYLEKRAAGKDTDPFLLILSQTGGLTFAKTSAADNELRSLVGAYGSERSLRTNDYLRVVAYYTAGSHEEDNFAVRKVLLYENVSVDEVHELVAAAMDRKVRLATVVREQRPEIIQRIRQTVPIVESAADDPIGAAVALVALLGLASAEILGAELAEFPIGEDVRSQEDEEAIETAGAVAPVASMTMIGSKGLSAHHVIVLGCDDMNMSRTTPLTFFVALTRARESLHLVVARKTGGSSEPHPFVYDLPEDCCEYVSYKKTGRIIEVLGSRSGFRKRIESWKYAEAKSKSTAWKKKSGPTST